MFSSRYGQLPIVSKDVNKVEQEGISKDNQLRLASVPA